jgi:acetolactate synthase I/II/III large subunit
MPTACPNTWRRAFHTALQGRPGPVVLVLPEDMLTEPTGAGAAARRSSLGLAGAGRAARPARDADGGAAALLIAGGSGWDAEGANALQRFAENWQLPVGCGFRFQDTFDNRHPLYAGDVGIGINPKLAARVREADLIIALGVRLGEMTTGGYTLLHVPRPKQKLVHMHAGPEELGRVYAADLLLQARWPAPPRRWKRWPRRRACPGPNGPLQRMPTTRPTMPHPRSNRWTWRW